MIIDKLVETANKITPISQSNIELLLLCTRQETLSKGQFLLKEGQVCSYLFFVESGFLRTHINHDGKEINTNFTFEGKFTCNLKSFKKEKPSHLSISAGEKTIVTIFDKNLLLEICSKSADIESFCRKILALLIIESEDQLTFYRLNKPKERYNFLINNHPEIVQRISVSQLSSYIGISRETLSRIRKKIT